MGVELEVKDFPVVGGNYDVQLRHGFRPRRDLKAVRLDLPLGWAMDPFGDRNWRFQLHAWRMLPAIWAHCLAGKAAIVDEVMPWVRDWHRFHLMEGRQAQMTWHDMATGIRAQHLALIGFLRKSGRVQLSAEDASLLYALADAHIRQLRDEEFIARGNHGIFQLVGLRLLGEVFPDIPATAGESEYSCRLMARLLKSQFGPLGVHVENSPSYHHFAIQQFGKIKPDLFPALKRQLSDVLAAARRVEPWFGMPDGRIVGFGDSEGMSKAILGGGDVPDMRSLRDDGRAVVAKDLSSAGYAIVRTDPAVPLAQSSMLAVKSQCLSSGHAQADHLTFELFERGRHLLVDSGKYSYDTTDFRKYFKSDRAHNVVGLAHREFDPGSTPPGSAQMAPVEVTGQGLYRIHAHVARGRDFRHERTFEYQPGLRLRIADRVEHGSGRAVAYFHLPPDLTASISADADSVDVIDMAGDQTMRFTFDARQLSPRLVHGQVKPHLQGWFSPSYRVKQAATVLELLAADGVRAWTVDIHVNGDTQERPPGPVSPWPITLPADIADRVRVRTVKSMVNEHGEREFRILFEHPEASVADMHAKMVQAVVATGYESTGGGQRQQGLGTSFSHPQTGARLRLLVRSKDVFPVKFPRMRGTTYLALTETTARRPRSA